MAEAEVKNAVFHFRAKKQNGKVPVKTGMLPGIAKFETVRQEPQEGLRRFDQAAGHSGALQEARDGSARLWKKVDERERRFYELAEQGLWRTDFLPKFYGVSDDGNSIIIENLVAGMKHPCVADFKMGVRSAEEHAAWRKRFRMRLLDEVTKTREVGLRLEGLSMFRSLEKLKVTGSKQQSHACSIGCKADEILSFFLTDHKGLRTDVASALLDKVKDLLAYFEEDNDRFMFVGSSILLIYDNNNLSPKLRWARALEHAKVSRWRINKFMETKVEVRMIDFAHYSNLPGQKPFGSPPRDHGYIQGLETLRDALEAVCNRSASKPRFEFSDVVSTAQSSSRLDDQLSGLVFSCDLSSSSDDESQHERNQLRRMPRRTFDHLMRKAVTAARDV